MFKGRDQKGSPVAIKRLKRHSSPQMMTRFKREARLLRIAALPNTHPNIAVLCDTGENYTILEWIEGTTLEDSRRLNRDEFVEMAKQLASALVRVHAKNIVHRDVKPANIMLVHDRVMREGWVKLLDFGVAKDLEEDEANDAQVAVGTLRFMAPEELQKFTGHDTPATTRLDIYSFGWTLLTKLTEEEYHAREAVPTEILAEKKRLRLPTSPPTKGVDQELWNLIRQCIEPDPDARPKSMQIVLDRLETIAKRHIPVFVSPKVTSEAQATAHPGTITTNRTAVIAPEAKKTTKPKSPRAALGALLALATALALFATFGLRGSERPQPIMPITPVVVTVPTQTEPPTPRPTPPQSRSARPRVVRTTAPLPRPSPTPAPRVAHPPAPPHHPTIAAHPLPTVVGVRRNSDGRGYTIPARSHWGDADVVRSRPQTCAGLRNLHVDQSRNQGTLDAFHEFCDGY